MPAAPLRARAPRGGPFPGSFRGCDRYRAVVKLRSEKTLGGQSIESVNPNFDANCDRLVTHRCQSRETGIAGEIPRAWLSMGVAVRSIEPPRRAKRLASGQDLKRSVRSRPIDSQIP